MGPSREKRERPLGVDGDAVATPGQLRTRKGPLGPGGAQRWQLDLAGGVARVDEHGAAGALGADAHERVRRARVGALDVDRQQRLLVGGLPVARYLLVGGRVLVAVALVQGQVVVALARAGG